VHVGRRTKQGRDHATLLMVLTLRCRDLTITAAARAQKQVPRCFAGHRLDASERERPAVHVHDDLYKFTAAALFARFSTSQKLHTTKAPSSPGIPSGDSL
jgi:hypothetical protein